MISSGRALALGLGAMVLLRVVVTAAFIAIIVWTGAEDPFGGSWQALVVLAGAALLQTGVVLGLARLSGTTMEGFGWRATRVGPDIALGAAGFAVIAVGLVLAIHLVGGMGLGAIWAQLTGYGPLERATFLLLAFLAGFVEESVFRGHLQPWFEDRLGPVGGMVAVALVFAVYHLNFRPLALFGKLLIGLVLGALRLRTGRLVAPAVAHGLVWVVLGTL